MFPGYMLQGGGSQSGISLQGGSTKKKIQGGSALQVQNATSGQVLQPTVNPQAGNNLNIASVGGAPAGPSAPLGLTNTAVQPGQDPAAAAAAAKAAADAAKAAALRGDITSIANAVKDIFNSRYGLVDAAAGEQVGKLNDRFATESGDITTQVAGENQKLGAAHAASGSFDSSYRGNNVDTVTRAGENQIRDLGEELQDNTGKIGAWVASQKGEFDGQKSGMDAILARLHESTDPAELTSIRNSLEARINELRGGQAAYNTNDQNRGALASIAPSNARAQQLKTTLSQIVAGNADASQKSAIGARLIQSAGLSPEESQALLSSFQGDLQKKETTTA